MENRSTRDVIIGFAMRAGRVTVGADMVCKSLAGKKDGGVRLVVLSHTASDATKRRLGYKCEFYSKRLITVDIDAEELGRLLGKTYAPAVIAISDEGFAKEIEAAATLYHEYLASQQTIERKEVSQEETGEPYAASNQNSADN